MCSPADVATYIGELGISKVGLEDKYIDWYPVGCSIPNT